MRFPRTVEASVTGTLRERLPELTTAQIMAWDEGTGLMARLVGCWLLVKHKVSVQAIVTAFVGIRADARQAQASTAAQCTR